MKKNLGIVFCFCLLSFASCAQTPSATEGDKTTEAKKDEGEKESGEKPLKKIGNGFKKLGHDIEQTFDRMSKKDKDGDGE
jgi:hypothetical protein